MSFIQQDLLPPLHPHCRCAVIPVYESSSALEQPVVAASPNADNHANWYDALLRIPSEAKALLNGFVSAQQERIGRGTLGGFLDWLTMGTVSGLYEGLKTRTDAMTKEPSLYNIVNWLTLGTADMVKGAFSPDEPLSLEHWLDSLGVVSIAFGAYELAQKYAPTMIDDVAAFEPSAKSDIFNATPSRETQIVRESKYLNVEGNIDWPRYAPNDGFVEGSQHMVTLDKDTLIDRYGAPNGSFVAPAGTLYEMRSLPYFENPYAYHEYRVIEPIENVKMGEIAPAFDQPGGGIQYLLPASIKDLLGKYIEEVK